MSSASKGLWLYVCCSNTHGLLYLVYLGDWALYNGHCICLEAKGTDQGIRAQTPGVNIIEGYSDSDWAGDRRSRKSVSAAAILVNGHFIYGASGPKE